MQLLYASSISQATANFVTNAGTVTLMKSALTRIAVIPPAASGIHVSVDIFVSMEDANLKTTVLTSMKE